MSDLKELQVGDRVVSVLAHHAKGDRRCGVVRQVGAGANAPDWFRPVRVSWEDGGPDEFFRTTELGRVPHEVPAADAAVEAVNRSREPEALRTRVAALEQEMNTTFHRVTELEANAPEESQFALEARIAEGVGKHLASVDTRLNQLSSRVETLSRQVHRGPSSWTPHRPKTDAAVDPEIRELNAGMAKVGAIATVANPIHDEVQVEFKKFLPFPLRFETDGHLTSKSWDRLDAAVKERDASSPQAQADALRRLAALLNVPLEEGTAAVLRAACLTIEDSRVRLGQWERQREEIALISSHHAQPGRSLPDQVRGLLLAENALAILQGRLRETLGLTKDAPSREIWNRLRAAMKAERVYDEASGALSDAQAEVGRLEQERDLVRKERDMRRDERDHERAISHKRRDVLRAALKMPTAPFDELIECVVVAAETAGFVVAAAKATRKTHLSKHHRKLQEMLTMSPDFQVGQDGSIKVLTTRGDQLLTKALTEGRAEKQAELDAAEPGPVFKVDDKVRLGSQYTDKMRENRATGVVQAIVTGDPKWATVLWADGLISTWLMKDLEHVVPAEEEPKPAQLKLRDKVRLKNPRATGSQDHPGDLIGTVTQLGRGPNGQGTAIECWATVTWSDGIANMWPEGFLELVPEQKEKSE